jgi:hypothetical protein
MVTDPLQPTHRFPPILSLPLTLEQVQVHLQTGKGVEQVVEEDALESLAMLFGADVPEAQQNIRVPADFQGTGGDPEVVGPGGSPAARCERTFFGRRPSRSLGFGDGPGGSAITAAAGGAAASRGICGVNAVEKLPGSIAADRVERAPLQEPQQRTIGVDDLSLLIEQSQEIGYGDGTFVQCRVAPDCGGLAYCFRPAQTCSFREIGFRFHMLSPAHCHGDSVRGQGQESC